MEIREIEAFLILAEELHFGRAAERLGVSSGRVSQLLAGLERRLGRRLVLRSSRTVKLSAAGEQFLAEARAGYRQLEHAVAAAQATAQVKAGVLGLGTWLWLGPAAGVDLCEAFEHRYPGWQARRVTISKPDLFSPLTDGDVDVVMLPIPGPPETMPPLPGIEIGPVLARQRRVLYVPGDHPLAAHDVVTPADVAGHQTILLEHGMPAWWVDGYLPAEWRSGQPGHNRQVHGLAEPHDAFDLVVRRRLAFLSCVGVFGLFRGADVTGIPVSGLPLVHTVLARRSASRDRLTTAFLAMAAESAAA